MLARRQSQSGTPAVGAIPPLSFHVFLSHDWGPDRANHAVIKRVNEALKVRGVVTWFDDDRNHGNADLEMPLGVESSAIFLAFVTANYETKVNSTTGKDNCQYEFRHARAILGSTRMLAVVLEASMRRSWTGSLGFVLNGTLYINASGLDADAVADKIIAELAHIRVGRRLRRYCSARCEVYFRKASETVAIPLRSRT